MRTFQENSCEFKLFDKVGELADRGAIETPAYATNAAQGLLSASFAGRKFRDYAAAGASLHERWEEGLAVVERMGEQLAASELPRPVSRRRRLKWDETAGDEVDFDRLRSGQEFWRTSRRASMAGASTKTILVDMGANCRVEAMDILWRGAAAVALTALLEDAGYRVELWSYSLASDVYLRQAVSDSFLATQLKAASDPLDPSTMVNAVSGWFFRSRVLHERCLGGLRPESTLGRHTVATADHLDHVTTDPDRVVVQGVWNFQAAVDLVRRTIQSL